VDNPTPNQASSQSPPNYIGNWTIRRKRNGIVVAEYKKKNVITNYGISQLAQAWSGTFATPNYLVVDSYAPTLTQNVAIGATQVFGTNTLAVTTGSSPPPPISNLIISLGQSYQESIQVSSITGPVSGVYTYNLASACTHTHNAGEVLARNPIVSDDMSKVISPVQYDATNNPNKYPTSVSGYSAGTGNFTMQFYFTANQLNSYISYVGLTDKATIGAGNLYCWLLLGFDHTQPLEDIEIDCSLTHVSV
jgi:hypothetical protein